MVNYYLAEKIQTGESPLSWDEEISFGDLISLEQPTWYKARSGRCDLLILKAKNTDAQTEGRPRVCVSSALGNRLDTQRSLFESFLRQMFLFLLYC